MKMIPFLLLLPAINFSNEKAQQKLRESEKTQIGIIYTFVRWGEHRALCKYGGDISI